MADHEAGTNVHGKEARAQNNFEAALAAFDTFRDDLNALLREARDGDTAAAKRLGPVVSELARAVSRIADEQLRLENHLVRIGAKEAADEGVSLDLAAARAEVCRRLAQLRAAREGE